MLGITWDYWEVFLNYESFIWEWNQESDIWSSLKLQYARHFMGISMGNIPMRWLAATQNVHIAQCAPEQLEIIQPSYTIKQLHLDVQSCLYLHNFLILYIYTRDIYIYMMLIYYYIYYEHIK